MKKKLGVIITLLTLCICLMTPQMHAKAARKNNDRCVCRFPEYRTDCDGNGKSIKCIRGQCICQYGFDL